MKVVYLFIPTLFTVVKTARTEYKKQELTVTLRIRQHLLYSLQHYSSTGKSLVSTNTATVNVFKFPIFNYCVLTGNLLVYTTIEKGGRQ
jgi:hypothetical protein